MNLLKKLILVTLLALWVPATSHCLLAALSGLESLTCCASENSSHDESDCATDVCASIEDGLFKLELHLVSAPLPVLSLVLFASAASDMLSFSAQLRERVGGLPPELIPSLPFSMRTAPAPRAPSALG